MKKKTNLSAKGRGEGRTGGRLRVSLLASPPPSPRTCSCFLLALLYSGRRVFLFPFGFFEEEKKENHFIFGVGGNCQGPSPSLALVSTVFVLLNSVQDLFDFSYFNQLFFLSLSLQFLRSTFGLFFVAKWKRQNLIMFCSFAFFFFWMHKSINETATKYNEVLTRSSVHWLCQTHRKGLGPKYSLEPRWADNLNLLRRS